MTDAGGIWQAAYIIAALAIVFSIKWLSSPVTARRGVLAGEIGMLFAVVGTLLRKEIVNYEWIAISFVIGAGIGAPLAYLMPMTSVPQLTALSHAFGAFAAALVGTAEYYRYASTGHPVTGFTMAALVIETVLGYLTCTASIMAFGKLQEIVPTRPITYKGQEHRQPRAVHFRGRPRRVDDRRTHARLGFPDLHRPLSCSSVSCSLSRSAAATCPPSSRSSTPTPARPAPRWASLSKIVC